MSSALRASMFSQPEQEIVLRMEVLLGVELFILTFFVLFGWGPEGYRSGNGGSSAGAGGSAVLVLSRHL